MAGDIIGTAEILISADTKQADQALSKFKGQIRDLSGATEKLAGGLDKSTQSAIKLGQEMLGAFESGGLIAVGIAGVVGLTAQLLKNIKEVADYRINSFKAYSEDLQEGYDWLTKWNNELEKSIEKTDREAMSIDDLIKSNEDLRIAQDEVVKSMRVRASVAQEERDQALEQTKTTWGKTQAVLDEIGKDAAERPWAYAILGLAPPLAAGVLAYRAATAKDIVEERTKALTDQAKVMKELANVAEKVAEADQRTKSDEVKKRRSKKTPDAKAEGADTLLVVDWAAADKALAEAERDAFDSKIDRRVERIDREVTLEEEANQYKINAYKKYLDELAYMQREEEARAQEFNSSMYSLFVDGFATSVGTVTQTLIEQGELTGPAMKKMAAGIIEGIAIQSAVKGAYEIAEGVAALAGVYTAPLAAGHFLAAGKYFAVAGLAGGVASGMGAGGSGVSTAGTLLSSPMEAKKKAEEDAKKKQEEMQKARSQESRAARAASRLASQTTGTVVNINFVGSAFVTKAQVGKEVNEALREYSKLKN